MTARMRLPTFFPISADSRPGSMVPPITVGLLVKVLAFSVEVVPDQKYRTKFAAMASLLVNAAPLPWMSVLTVRAAPGWAFGMVTLGAWPNKPVAVTDVFVPAAGEADDEDEDEAAGFDEPQPARTTQASRGMAMSARKRRMKNLNGGGCQLRQPTGCSGPGGRSWPRGDDPPGTPRLPAAVLAVVSPGRGAVGPRGQAI